VSIGGLGFRGRGLGGAHAGHAAAQHAVALDDFAVLRFADHARQAAPIVLGGAIPAQLSARAVTRSAGGIVIVVEGGGVELAFLEHLEDLVILGVRGEHHLETGLFDAQLRLGQGVHFQIAVEGTVLIHPYGKGVPDRRGPLGLGFLFGLAAFAALAASASARDPSHGAPQKEGEQAARPRIRIRPARASAG
jgi:hypothetical protein